MLSSKKETRYSQTKQSIDDDFGDADIQWITDTVEKQNKNNLISIQELRKEMGTFRKPTKMGIQRKQDALGSTWHGPANRTTSMSSKSNQTLLSTTLKPSRTTSVPTMEELQTIMAAKEKYSNVTKVLGNDLTRVDFESKVIPKVSPAIHPIGGDRLPTVDDLESLMATVSVKLTDSAVLTNKPRDSLAGSRHHCRSRSNYTTGSLSPCRISKHIGVVEPKKDSSRESHHRSRTHGKISISPTRKSYGGHPTAHVEKNCDLLRTSHHRPKHRSETNHTPTRSAVPGGHDDQGNVFLSSPRLEMQYEEYMKPLARTCSRERRNHDPLRSSQHKKRRDTVSDSEDDNRRKDLFEPTRSRSRGTATRQSKDKVGKNDSDSGSMPLPEESMLRKRSSSRGRRTALANSSSGSDEDGNGSRRKSRSVSGERQRVSTTARGRQRRLLKGTKQSMMNEIPSPSEAVKSKGLSIKVEALSEGEDDDGHWMAFSTMSFDNDWDNFQPKATRPILDPEKALIVAAKKDAVERKRRKQKMKMIQ